MKPNANVIIVLVDPIPVVHRIEGNFGEHEIWRNSYQNALADFKFQVAIVSTCA